MEYALLILKNDNLSPLSERRQKDPQKKVPPGGSLTFSITQGVEAPKKWPFAKGRKKECTMMLIYLYIYIFFSIKATQHILLPHDFLFSVLSSAQESITTLLKLLTYTANIVDSFLLQDISDVLLHFLKTILTLSSISQFL